MIDTSASMGATDVTPTRLDAAKAAAIDALKDLPAGGKVSVIAAGRTARVVANGTSDLGNVKQAIAGIAPTTDVGDLGDALRLASALAARSGDAEILVASDAAMATPPKATVDAPIRVLQVGRDVRNEAIVALAVRTAPSGLSHSAFVSVANMGMEPAERRIQLYADGVLRDSRVLALDPQRKTDIVIDDVDDPTHPASVVEVRLVGQGRERHRRAGPAGARRPGVGHRAARGPADRPARRARATHTSRPRCRTCPNTELYGVTPDKYGPGTKPEAVRPGHLRGLPARPSCPPSRSSRSRRRSSSPLGTVTGTLTNPGIGSLDSTDPILRYVDLSTTHIGEARKMELPAWARAVIPGPGTSPLLYAGTFAGRPAAVMAFEPRRSDLPLQVAFPVMLANLAGELLGGSETPADAIAPGAPVTLQIPAGAKGVRVERPDGSADELLAPTAEAASVTFARTDLLGVYTVTPIADPDATPTPTRPPRPLRRPRRPSAARRLRRRRRLARRLADLPPRRPERPGAVRGRPP